MKSAGLKKKRVKVRSVPAKGLEREQEFIDATLVLDNKINEILKKDGHLVYLDEAVFKEKDYTRTAWSSPKQNL